MKHFRLPSGGLLAVAALGLALASAESLAQRATTGGTRRATTSGGGGGGAGTTRSYQNNTMVGDAMISADPETRSLIIVTDEETNERIQQVISNLDRPKPQVLIKVVFVQVTHNDDLDFGVEGQYNHNVSSAGVNGSATDPIAGQGSSAFGLASQTSGGFYKIISDDLSLTLRAMATAGKTEILSRPSILARNSQQATIIVGQEVPFITNSRVTDNGQTINTVTYQDIGIILRVTPFITSEGLVEMIVQPEISTLSDRTVPISDTVSSPVIDKRSADTVVVTQDGKTIVIGGLIDKQKTKQVRKVPLLGDIPVLGHLFKRTIQSDTKTELLIFLTPHVVQSPADMAKLTGDEAAQMKFAPNSFGEEELNRALQGIPERQPAAPESAPASTPKAAAKPKPAGRGNR